MDLLLIGPVTVASIVPAIASSMTLRTASKDAWPAMAEISPQANLVISTVLMSSTSIVPGSNNASFTSVMVRTGVFQPRWPAVYCISCASPTINGRQMAVIDLVSSALRAISGPMLAGSPMVIPIMGNVDIGNFIYSGGIVWDWQSPSFCINAFNAPRELPRPPPW